MGPEIGLLKSRLGGIWRGRELSMNKLLTQRGLWSIQCNREEVKSFDRHCPMPQAWTPCSYLRLTLNLGSKFFLCNTLKILFNYHLKFGVAVKKSEGISFLFLSQPSAIQVPGIQMFGLGRWDGGIVIWMETWASKNWWYKATLSALNGLPPHFYKREK